MTRVLLAVAVGAWGCTGDGAGKPGSDATEPVCEPDWVESTTEDEGTVCVEPTQADVDLALYVIAPRCYGSGSGECAVALDGGQILVSATFSKDVDANDCGDNTDACFDTIARCALTGGVPAGQYEVVMGDTVQQPVVVPGNGQCDTTYTEY